jgi:hypothetical protein
LGNSSLSQSLNVWGKTLTATGGTLAFLVSLIIWGAFSGQRTFQETIVALALNFASLAPIIGALIPRISGKIQGVILLGLGGVFVAVWIGYVALISGGFFLPLSLTLPLAAMIFVGGLLVYFSKVVSE